jgi:hypothetical protein
MYQIILILILIAAVAWIYWLIKNGRIEKKSSKKVVTDSYTSFIDLLRFKEKKIWANIRILSYYLTLLCTFLLVLTGFLPVIFTGKHLSGILLIFHVTIAPLFCISLAVLALFWAHALRFVISDRDLFTDKSFSRIFLKSEISDSWQKMIFWLFLLLSLPAILSIVLSMYPLFGPDGQEILLQVHRYATLFLFILAVVHTTAIIVKARPSAQKTDKSV